jgi:hypothetical protein
MRVNGAAFIANTLFFHSEGSFGAFPSFENSTMYVISIGVASTQNW